ncbi:hypothetical protein IMSAG249_01457 [Lachnospiraceae bacterium]|nr:hypothetical protein IMSAG249_01457 [Lachnospiraceae bacterium]
MFLPLIEEVFHVSYKKEDIVPLNSSLYNGDGEQVEADNAFLVNGVTYHFECQYTNIYCQKWKLSKGWIGIKDNFLGWTAYHVQSARYTAAGL